MRRSARPALLVGLAALLALRAWAEDGPSLATLRKRLLEARGAQQTGAVLDALAERIGQPDGFEDAGALGDWLGRLPAPRAQDPVVLARRGWAYVSVRRGAEAVEPLEAARAKAPHDAFTLAMLGEAYRQAGRSHDALAALAQAAGRGYAEPFAEESAVKAAFALRKERPVETAEGLPDYATAAEPFLLARPAPVAAATLARWMLDDLEAYERGDAPRARAWADFAGRHALTAIRADPTQAGIARLAYDAAVALAPQDQATEGRSDRQDLLAHAIRAGDRPERDGHDVPQALVALAEDALREGRFELAARLARKRLRISDSPAARRVLAEVPIAADPD